MLAVVAVGRIEARRGEAVVDTRRLGDLSEPEVVVKVPAELLLDAAGEIAGADRRNPIGEAERLVVAF